MLAAVVLLAFAGACFGFFLTWERTESLLWSLVGAMAAAPLPLLLFVLALALLGPETS